mmetsp:Transcript_16684/g.36569  ORF Transcript_16684/g.36569 Transcript_16684/m.36569 type:complete len:234 (-) Transcript_16684:251-952(-)
MQLPPESQKARKHATESRPSGMWCPQRASLAFPPCSLEDKLMLLPHSRDAGSNSFSVRLSEAHVLRAIDSILLEAALAPPCHPCALVLIKEDTPHSTSTLIWLWLPQFPGILQMLEHDDCTGPGLFKFAWLPCRKGAKDLHPASVPHHHPLPHAVIPNDMSSAVLIHRNPCPMSSLRPEEFHPLPKALLMDSPRPDCLSLPLKSQNTASSSCLHCSRSLQQCGLSVAEHRPRQ